MHVAVGGRLVEAMAQSDPEDSFPGVLARHVVVQFIGELEAARGRRELRVVVQVARGVRTDVSERLKILVQLLLTVAEVVEVE